MTYQVICVLGSSTANGYWDEEGLGWVNRLSMKVSKEFPYKFGFNNLAQSGDTSLDMLHRLTGEALSRDPDILILSGGANDLNRWHAADAPTDFSEEKTKQNWQTMLSVAKKNVSRILVVGIPAVKESNGSRGDIFRSNGENARYNQNLKTFCNEHNVAFLDFTNLWSEKDIAEYVYDNVHPTAKGHQLIADKVFEKLDEMSIFQSEAI